MLDPLKKYWRVRLKEVKKTLEGNNFDVFIADDRKVVHDIVLKEIIPSLKPKTVSWGGSVTFTDIMLYEVLKGSREMKVLDTFNKKLSDSEKLELRRQALLTDLFITGSNALTDTGKLGNLDMIGNRVAAITFGPRNVIIIVGRNKIVADVDEAILRIKNLAAPANVSRLGMKNPCLKTGYCEECQSKFRICNNWTITEKSYPKGRIKIILINEDLGL
ncbi:MAG: lactate utilization protein [Deltaproteobacteria bacterium]|nr:lactate utilization protein [Deltaproteobacteria bacterium]